MNSMGRHLTQPHIGGNAAPSVFRALTMANILGLTIIASIILCALFAPFIAPHDPLAQDLAGRLRPPAFMNSHSLFIFGSDALGRDIWSRVWFGARASLVIASASVVLAMLLGVSAGLVSGFVGGWGDALLARVADVQQAIPYLVLAIAVVAVLGSTIPNLIAVLGLTSWVTFFRMVRAQTLALREQDFVLAAQALGASRWRIITRHIAPNVWSSVVTLATVLAANIIIFEAALGFLGLGVPPPQPSWGSILADGRDYITDAWWIMALPGGILALLGLGLNLLGENE